MHTYCWAFNSGAVTTSFYNLVLHFAPSNTQPSARKATALTDCATVTAIVVTPPPILFQIFTTNKTSSWSKIWEWDVKQQNINRFIYLLIHLSITCNMHTWNYFRIIFLNILLHYPKLFSHFSLPQLERFIKKPRSQCFRKSYDPLWWGTWSNISFNLISLEMFSIYGSPN